MTAWRRHDYEQDVLSAFARLAGRRAPGISDETLGGEYRAQRIFYAALERFRADVANAAPFTDLRRDALSDLLAGLEDTTPDRRAWDEAIMGARRDAC
ncbi:MAG: hypothetical protein JSR25_10610 [Proteobacteria bacterium]|nr:hypothetical protein [Pseudomonadota bacterium]